MRNREFKTPSKSSPKDSARACLCPDNTYSRKCCDGSLQAQGIGSVYALKGVFTSRDELIIAVDLWLSDNSLALRTYGEINTWNVTDVTDMSSLFSAGRNGDNIAFNSDISNWDISNVENMNAMFANAYAFNQPIGSWDTSSALYMGVMFVNAQNFNQDISNWNVSNVSQMNRMFNDAISFNQDLSGWNVNNVSICNEFSLDATNWILPQPVFTICNP